MKRTVFFLLWLVTVLHAGQTHAQWGGFLDPNIIRDAGIEATNGSPGSFGIESPSQNQIIMLRRSQHEIEEERLSTQRAMANLQEIARTRALIDRVNRVIDGAYTAEFVK
jgi:hypothetical protein